MNIRNNVTAIGRVTRKPVIMKNADGSRKCMFTVAAQDNFRDREGNKNAQYVPFEAFISNKNADNGVYDLIHKGDLIAVQGTVKTGSYVDKTTGETVYKVTLVPENIDLLEPKSTTEARAKKNESEEKAPVAQAPQATAAAEADEELPFKEEQ